MLILMQISNHLNCHSIILKYIKNISNKLAINGKLDTKLDTSSYVKSSNGSLLGLVKNNEVWLIIFNRISTLDTCVCVASRYADVVSVFTVSKSATMSINYNNQGTITVAYNGSTDGVFGGAFKFYG